jgi:hypothetical protein
MTAPTDLFRGMTPEDRARAVAYAAEQRAIQTKREAAARTLLAPAGPAEAVKAAWQPVKDALDAQQAQAVTGAQENRAKPVRRRRAAG